MSEPLNDPHARLLELASLRPGDSRRKEMDHELSLMSEAERARWMQMMHETDVLHGALPEVEIPVDLQSRLLRIPNGAGLEEGAPAPAPLGKISPRRWRFYAASLLILVPLAGLAVWNMPGSGPTPPSFALAAPKADEIANLAEQLQESNPALAVSSSDAATVEHALNDAMKPYHMPFPAMLLKPKEPLTLQGGGVVAFGKTHAVFTRWSSGKSTFTVYQFDGKPLDVPAGFSDAIVSAKDGHYVSIWPGYGNPCTWAVVADSKSGAAVFD